jgi:hypothetical protein
MTTWYQAINLMVTHSTKRLCIQTQMGLAFQLMAWKTGLTNPYRDAK